jgi:soluble lytic murein transglycosylase-like protein
MQIRLNWQSVALLSALALTASAVSARPQDQIALVHNTQGAAVYVNRAEAAPLVANSVGLSWTAGARDPTVHQLISQTARSLAVDPNLVEAVVRVESGYDALARSPNGALGLMQLMPATAARFGVRNPFDAAENIRGGVTYLGHLLKQFNGDVPLSLAAYNAGEGAVVRKRGIPPFRETLDYIRKVAALYPSSARTSEPMAERQSAFPDQTHDRGLTADNAASPVPIYRYMDTQGVIHFTQ